LKYPQHSDESLREINHSAKYLKQILKKMRWIETDAVPIFVK
jgi:hypothetical protein